MLHFTNILLYLLLIKDGLVSKTSAMTLIIIRLFWYYITNFYFHEFDDWIIRFISSETINDPKVNIGYHFQPSQINIPYISKPIFSLSFYYFYGSLLHFSQETFSAREHIAEVCIFSMIFSYNRINVATFINRRIYSFLYKSDCNL